MKQGAMRTYIAAGGVALILSAGAVGYGLFVKNTADKIEKVTQVIETAVQTGDFNTAEQNLTALFSFLDNNETILGATINHNDIYNLRLAMGELSARIEEESKYECIACVNTLKTRIRQLEQNSVPSLFNIL